MSETSAANAPPPAPHSAYGLGGRAAARGSPSLRGRAPAYARLRRASAPSPLRIPRRPSALSGAPPPLAVALVASLLPPALFIGAAGGLRSANFFFTAPWIVKAEIHRASITVVSLSPTIMTVIVSIGAGGLRPMSVTAAWGLRPMSVTAAWGLRPMSVTSA